MNPRLYIQSTRYAFRGLHPHNVDTHPTTLFRRSQKVCSTFTHESALTFRIMASLFSPKMALTYKQLRFLPDKLVYQHAYKFG